MKRDEVKKNALVIDTWTHGSNHFLGKIIEVRKTFFRVKFGDEIVRFDYPHAKFLTKTSRRIPKISTSYMKGTMK